MVIGGCPCSTETSLEPADPIHIHIVLVALHDFSVPVGVLLHYYSPPNTSIMLILLLFLRSTICEVIQPHVVYILADDLGWNEVSWNNPGFLTPNLERLAMDGVLLNQSYVSPKCSPSRAALLTGLYPWRLGMQRGAIGKITLTSSHT